MKKHFSFALTFCLLAFFAASFHSQNSNYPPDPEPVVADHAASTHFAAPEIDDLTYQSMVAEQPLILTYESLGEVAPTLTTHFDVAGEIHVMWRYEPTVFGMAATEMIVSLPGRSPDYNVVSMNQDWPGTTRFFCDDALYALYDSCLGALTIFMDKGTYKTYYASR